VIVPDDQLSLAIGKDGLNARLAARLTGWRVDIRSETEFAEEEAEMGYAEEEVAGRCAAILANGKRCPNASLPGSRYCGIPAHQELEGKDTDYVVPPEGDGDGGEPSEEEPAAEEVVAGAPSPEDVMADQPSADEIVEAEPSVDEVLEGEPSVDEIVEGEPAADQADASVDGGAAEEPAEADAPGSEEAKQS
jgi:N utilization substance protein A